MLSLARLAAITCAAIMLAQPSRAAFVPAPVPQSAYNVFSSSVSSSSGSLTSASATVRWQQTGKRVDFSVSVSVTTNGTGAGFIIVTLPVAAQGGGSAVVGRDVGVSGKSLQGIIQTGSTMAIFNYDGSYPAANGANLILSGAYEAQ